MEEGYRCECGYYWKEKGFLWFDRYGFPACPKCGKKMTRYNQVYFMEEGEKDV